MEAASSKPPTVDIQLQLRIGILKNKGIAPLQQAIHMLTILLILQIMHQVTVQVGHMISAVAGYHMRQ
ncbi:hypothetical protein D3C74_425420 [compost metagenome]